MQIINLLKNILTHPLNRGYRYKAIKRLIAWQVASRIMAGPIAFPFVEDSKLFAAKGMTGATGNLYCGLHEVEEMAFILHVLEENDIFVDIGANVGSYSVLAAAGPKAKVISIEPIPSTFQKLSLNIKLNNIDQFVSAYCVGVSDKIGVLKFSSNLDTTNHVIAEDEKIPAIEVKVLTLDEVIANRCPTVIKIDVEGHEIPALRGGHNTLNNPTLLAVVMETNGSGARFGYTDQDLENIMVSYGFSVFNYEPFGRDLLPRKKGSVNTVFVRDKKEVLRRVKNSRKFRVGHTFI